MSLAFRSTAALLLSLLTAAGICCGAHAAGDRDAALAASIDRWLADPADASLAPALVEPAAVDQPRLINPAEYQVADGVRDDAVAPAQLQGPLANLGFGVGMGVGTGTLPAASPYAGRQPAALRTGAAVVGLASIPYMIGDTGAGTCVGFGGLLDLEVSHPTLACGRLNVAENNSPIPANRVYMSYRHFENASPVSIYQFREAYNIDRWTLASERTMLDGMASWEVRLPMNYQIRRDIISVFDQVSGAADLVADPNRQFDLGNLSLIFKCGLLESDAFYLSGGLGLTLPTARDVRYRVAYRGEVAYTQFPGFTVDSLTALSVDFQNETVYLAPFASWIYAPRGPWFHQGFLQFETAANPSRVTAEGVGLNTFQFNGSPIGFYDYFFPGPTDANLYAQTLMRLNLGVGRELMQNPRGSFVQRLVGLAEMHYTSTLGDAILSELPTTSASGGIVLADFQRITVGNQANRVDILNAALGVQANMGRFLVTNGFVAPVRQAPDRGFDFEYNCQVQMLY